MPNGRMFERGGPAKMPVPTFVPGPTIENPARSIVTKSVVTTKQSPLAVKLLTSTYEPALLIVWQVLISFLGSSAEDLGVRIISPTASATGKSVLDLRMSVPPSARRLGAPAFY
jgi:hypothetical protein